MTVKTKERLVTEYTIGMHTICTAEPGKIFVSGHSITTKAELQQYIATLDKAAEAANLQ